MQAARGASLTPTDPATDRATAPSASRPVGLLASAALATLALDVATKVWVVERLQGDTIRLFDGVLLLRQSRNPGAAFGIAGGATVLFTVIAVVVITVIVRTAPRLRSNGWALALGLILGGATGNLVDRVLRAPGPFRGAVVDFIDLQVWPSFNIADSGIVVGGLIAALLSLRGVEPAGPASGAEATAEAGDT